jgi:hypothetical protein
MLTVLEYILGISSLIHHDNVINEMELIALWLARLVID